MRVFVRVVVPLSLLVSGASLLPLAAIADPVDGSTATASAGATAGPTPAATDGATDGATGGATASDTPSATDGSSGSSSPSATATGDPRASGTAGPRANLAPQAVDEPTPTPTRDPTLVTTITSRPASFSLSRTAGFSYRANRTAVQFQCRLMGPHRRSTAFQECPATGTTPTTTTGSTSYSRLPTNIRRYTFTVRAYTPLVPATTDDPPVPAVPEVDGVGDAFSWRIYSVFRRTAYAPGSGASFNTPIDGRTSQRVNLRKVIKTIDAMPGYRQGTQGGPCPTVSSLWPSTIRISLYSMTDGAFSEAVRAANRRCVSVQVLMNNHLTPATDYAWKLLERALGNTVYKHGQGRRSFAHRCHFGCRGHGVLHTKMYLFDSQVPAPLGSANRINNTVMVGSSNITSNASHVQWNDLYTIRSNSRVHADYLKMFNKMKSGHKSSHLYRFSEGMYSSVFWPQGSSPDPYRTWLDGVRCTGATGGSGIGGRTVVYVNMHAWFGTRGLGLARQIRGFYDHGCYVRVLYGFMSHKVFTTLRNGTGSRMSVRRTLFSHDGRTGYLYTHLKNIDISGNFGGDSSSWVVSTGSNNFTNEGTHFDEVALRIHSHAAYNSYVRRFKYISRRRSSSTYANYSEPTGGGRAP